MGFSLHFKFKSAAIKFFNIWCVILLFVLPYSCISLEEEDNIYAPPVKNDFNVVYNIRCFPDYNGTGIYALDPRPLYNNILYRFDIQLNKWEVVGNHSGLPVRSRYDLLFRSLHFYEDTEYPSYEVPDAGTSSSTFITYFNAESAFEFSLSSKSWSVIPMEYVGGNFRKTIFNPYNRIFYKLVDSSLYAINGDYSLKKLGQITGNAVAKDSRLCQFFHRDSMAIARFEYNEDNIYSYPYTADTTWTLSIIDTELLKVRKIQTPLLDSLNPDMLYFDKLSEGKIYALKDLSLYYIDLNKSTLVNVAVFNPDILVENKFNKNNWAEITYRLDKNCNLFFINNQICLFFNEQGFVLNESDKSWTPLPVLEFDKFNSL